MNGEILSIETARKLSELEKKNTHYEKIISDFDNEINRLSNIIKRAYKYVDKELFAEYVQIKDLENILSAGINKTKEVKSA